MSFMLHTKYERTYNVRYEAFVMFTKNSFLINKLIACFGFELVLCRLWSLS